jgi:anti-sigma B factor antagonist
VPKATDVFTAEPRTNVTPYSCSVTMSGMNAAWIHVAGELDLATAPKLEQALREAQMLGGLVVLDAREVTFIDSAGVHVIADASNDAEWGGARLIVATGRVLDRMLALTGIGAQISTLDLSTTELGPDGEARPSSAASAADLRRLSFAPRPGET